MKRILFLTSFTLLLLTACEKENVEMRTDVLADIVGVYIGETTEMGTRGEVHVDQDGNIVSIEEFRVDETYGDTVRLVRQAQDSVFSLENKDRVLATFKWNEDLIFQTEIMRKDTTGDIIMKMEDEEPFQLKFEMNVQAGDIDADPVSDSIFDLEFYFLGTKVQ